MPSLFSPPPPGVYEYTEIITFQFTDSSAPSSLSDEATDVGRVWASTLRTYLELEQTGIVWWGLVHGSPQEAKLLIDWKSAEGREKYEASPQLKDLRSAWKAVTSVPVVAAVYRFPHDEVARQAGLCSSNDTVSVLFTFSFNSPVESSTDTEQWDVSFAQLRGAVMGSPGGVVATKCSYGWELNHSSYCAAFRFLKIDTFQTFLEESEVSQLLEGLRSRATGGVNIQFLDTRAFSHGWQGSVDRTTPETAGTAAFIETAQTLFKGINTRAA
ncbi:hypothetical protein AK830_g11408 [Neonectria ditissima]|uniref:ABM domain-containing protein n=1 Tax=Neonectria ditissima TaxID=78410 RepID=A0A0N8H546_9HYPO|nr:hypothetical protein AK830_g11408 [Neonectria ditissima]